MTSGELLSNLTPTTTKRFPAQLVDKGLSVNLSDMFCTFVKDAARCNGYNSDVYYSMKEIDKAIHNFNPDLEFIPIWLGFRKLGVDGTDYILIRTDKDNLYRSMTENYFALYSVTVEFESEGFYKVVMNEYAV